MHPNRPPSSSGNGSDAPPPHRHFPSGRSSFAHHLPPPIPSQPSPSSRYFNPASPNYRDGLGPTDPGSWASDRPTSNRSSNRWSPTLPALAISPRTHTVMTSDRDRDRDRQLQQRSFSLSQHHPSQHRLPPLDFPQRPGSGWGDPPSTGHSSTSRPPTAYEPYRPGSSSFPLAPPPPPPHYQPYSSVQPTHQSNPYFQRERDLLRDREQRRIAPAPTDDADSPDPRGESPSGDTGKKKKRRIALSCAECAKRKQKCNRETPCQHCVSRRVPELCVPYTRNNTSPQPQQVKTEKKVERERQLTGGSQPSVGQQDQAQMQVARTPGMLPTLSVRVGRLEAMVNAMINRVGGLEGKALHDWRINHAPATTPPPNAPMLLQVSPGTRPDTGDTVIGREGSAGQEAGLMTGIDEESSTRNPLPQSMLESIDPVPLGLDYHGTPAEQLQRLFTDCGVSPHKIQDLIAELPPRSDANDLIDWFFTKINHVRYPISEFLFRQSFVLIYENKTISGAAVLALPLVFIVLAMAIRVAPDQWVGGEDQKRTNSLRMYWNARMAINMASAVKAENLQLVETRICTGLYLVLMHERRLAEGWAEFRAALTTGQAIGLHRDGKKLGLDPYMTEYRRRLWSYLVHADGTYSCLLGRPISIDSHSCDTLPPSNIDIETYQPPLSQPLPAHKPIDQPSFATYLIIRRNLGEIVARVTKHFQRLDGGGEYKDVEELDKEFKGLREGLPAFFRMENPDQTWDEKCWYLPVHRYYIQTEILHFTIILHRPWLLRKLKSSRYRLSRQACFEAAVTDYKIRQAWKQECPDFFETLLGGSFREFNVAMIAGISMIVDPRGLHAADMRQIVQSFMQEHPHDPRADDFTQKEAAIIHTLNRRAQEMEDRRAAQTTHVRPSISNERGRPLNPHGTSASSYAGSQDDSPMLDEDGESRRRMPAPVLPSRSSGDHNATPSKSPLGNFMMGQMANMTPASSGSEDDNPQRLLNQWLISNTYFGPGSDNTMNPFNTSYPSIMPYQFDPSDTSMAYQPLQAQLDNNSLNAGNTGLYQGIDTTLTPSTSLRGLGIDTLGSGGTGGGIYTGGGNDLVGEIPSLVGPPGQDGNPTVFWERLIDGIVVGQGYDLSGTGGQS